jgi:hypothetical protein
MAMIHFGYALSGKVDQMPGGFYVATRFFEVSGLPVFPEQSYLVTTVDRKTGEWYGTPIPLSAKSLRFAWVRAMLFYTTIFFAVSAIAFGGTWNTGAAGPIPFVFTLTVAILSPVCHYWTYVVSRASPLRALEVGQIAGIPPEAIAFQYAASIDPDRLRELVAAATPPEDSTP